MYIATIPVSEINAISAALAEGLLDLWTEVRTQLASESALGEEQLQQIYDNHYQHILNNVYNSLKKGGHVAN